MTTKLLHQRHIDDIVTGCCVPNKYGWKCGQPVVGRGIGSKNDNAWRVAVCERHLQLMVSNDFPVKRYGNQSEGVSNELRPTN